VNVAAGVNIASHCGASALPPFLVQESSSAKSSHGPSSQYALLSSATDGTAYTPVTVSRPNWDDVLAVSPGRNPLTRA
jgi:hypothetical protein